MIVKNSAALCRLKEATTQIKHCIPGRGRAISVAVNNRGRGGFSECVLLPDGAPGWKEGLFWVAGLLNAEAGFTLPFLGAAADLEYVFAAGEVYATGVVLSTASLENNR